MPESIEDFHARVMAAQTDAGGRLPLDPEGYTTWSAFPFDGQMVAKEVEPLADREPPREGSDPETCHCAPGRQHHPTWPVRWRDDHWQIKLAPPSGSPVILVLEPRQHGDLGELPLERAAEYGVLSVLLTRAIEELPSVGRCHIGRWGDGGAQAHVWFIARPLRMPQTRGTFNALWDDILPAVPEPVRRENADAVLTRLQAAYGGELIDG